MGSARLASSDRMNHSSENISFQSASFDRADLTTLFGVVEIAEPALLLCRDALIAGEGGPECINAVNDALDRIGDVKRRLLVAAPVSNEPPRDIVTAQAT
jgi:hypothetical protein